jgi:hypothetical protein
MRKRISNGWIWLWLVFGILALGYAFMWFIQTAWLSSFPEHPYSATRFNLYGSITLGALSLTWVFVSIRKLLLLRNKHADDGT